jgi:hypothetical protein
MQTGKVIFENKIHSNKTVINGKTFRNLPSGANCIVLEVPAKIQLLS